MTFFKSASDKSREKLISRAKKMKIPDHKLKPPSQKRSENLKKKLSRGYYAGEIVYDCRDCPDKPTCQTNPQHCSKKFLTYYCNTCGAKVVGRIVEGSVFYCERCRSTNSKV